SVTALVALLVAYYLIHFLSDLLERYTQSYEEIERLDVVQRNRFQELFDTRMYRKLSRLPSECFEVPAINDRMERVFQFTQEAWSGLNRQIMMQGYMIVSKAVSVASIAASLYILEPTLAWLALLAPIPTLYTTFAAEKLRFKFVRDNTKQQREAAYYEKLMLGPAAKEMKALRLHDFFFGKWKALIDDYVKKERRIQIASALLGLVSRLITGAASVGATVLAILRMTQGRLSLGGLGAALSLIASLLDDTDRLFSAIGGFLSKKNEAAMFFDLMDLPEASKADQPILEIEEVRAENVGYRYPMTEKYVLRDVNLTLRRGEHIAFVGENGAGKTTFARILTGMLAPSTGELCVNGEPTQGVSQREGMATVLQTPARYYTFTVAENVWLGDVAREGNVSDALAASGFDAAPPDALRREGIGIIDGM
ncbi:MAG TPA: ABC transporter ATP-binding protein, partial [Clostridia bacterium]|nr:ABC transporter ATP-binding protein [Clostridia bacterium]